MDFINKKKIHTVNRLYLSSFLNKFWFIPSDVLQRGMEANIWDKCRFTSPVLDIGVGNGEISNDLFKNHSQFDVGIDIDNSQLDAARATKRYKKVMCVDAEKMPFADGSFTTVISNSTFEHIENDGKAVSEVARILKKNGLFFITVPSNFLQEWILEYEKNRNKKRAWKKLDIFNKRANHLHYRSYKEWEKYFKKHKLEVVFYKHYFQKDVALYWYKLFTFFTCTFRGRELWSLLGDSKLTQFLPKKLIKKLLENIILKNAFEKGFFIDGEGAQLFMIVKKI